jgi:hypothetical protein
MGAKRVGNGEEGIAGSSPLFQDLHPGQGIGGLINLKI